MVDKRRSSVNDHTFIITLSISQGRAVGQMCRHDSDCASSNNMTCQTVPHSGDSTAPAVCLCRPEYVAMATGRCGKRYSCTWWDMDHASSSYPQTLICLIVVCLTVVRHCLPFCCFQAVPRVRPATPQVTAGRPWSATLPCLPRPVVTASVCVRTGLWRGVMGRVVSLTILKKKPTIVFGLNVRA